MSSVRLLNFLLSACEAGGVGGRQGLMDLIQLLIVLPRTP